MVGSVFSTHQFKKDTARLKKQGRNMRLLRDTLDLLIEEQPLPKRYRNHQLHGDFAGCCDCHIQPDWILIYEYRGNELRLYRTGSHSELYWIESSRLSVFKHIDRRLFDDSNIALRMLVSVPWQCLFMTFLLFPYVGIHPEAVVDEVEDRDEDFFPAGQEPAHLVGEVNEADLA